MRIHLYKIPIILALFCSLSMGAKGRLINESGKHDSFILIVVDEKTFVAAQNEIYEYRDVLNTKGLGVAILYGSWNEPLALREEIRKIYKGRGVMEGLVLMGDIPVVRVRNFQHGTTAFKMDEENFPITESSVTSDRFYDDLDLKFEFLSVDKTNPRHFYFKLSEESPQEIKSEFYSARMLPPSDRGLDAHEQMRSYLKKVVKAHKENNYADRIIFFNGHGYNSDCMTAWQNQQFAIREQFPQAFKTSKGNGFFNFRQDPFMKFRLYSLMQREGTDLFVFHEHGDYDTQYINGEYPAQFSLDSRNGSMNPVEAMSVSLRNIYRRYKGERAKEFKERYSKELSLDSTFFSQRVMDSTRVSDSTIAANYNIVLKDLLTVRPMSRVTIFDACYNASFHKPGYVAGYHVFGDGATVVAQGNTVNVLQDKWSMELIGMLSEGARVGFWQKEVQTLESHLIGDPTYSFVPGSACNDRAADGVKLNKLLAQGAPQRVWITYLESDNPVYQAIALKQLSKSPPAGYSHLLMKVLKESKDCSVRMQAFKRLLDLADRNLADAIYIALNDPYELIRRIAARYAGFCGDQILIEPLVNTLIFSPESQRVQFSAQNSLEMFDASIIASSKTSSNEIVKYYNDQQMRQEQRLKQIIDKEAPQSARISAVRNLRNYNNHKQTTQLIGVLKDNADDLKVRINLAEALGWFKWSINKIEVINGLEEVLKDKSTPWELKGEIKQSLIRLR